MRDGIRHHKLFQLAVIQCLNRIAAQYAMSDDCDCFFCTMSDDNIGRFDKSAASVSHVVDDDSNPVLDITDKNHARNLIWASTFLVDQRKAKIKTISDRSGSFCAPCIRTDDDALLDWQVLSNPPECARFGVQVIYRDIEEALDLASMQIHGDDMVTACRLQHVCHELRRNGGTRFVLLVLSGIREIWYDSRDATSRGGFTCVDHDKKLHQPIVDVARRRRLKDEYVFIADGFTNGD